MLEIFLGVMAPLTPLACEVSAFVTFGFMKCPAGLTC